MHRALYFKGSYEQGPILSFFIHGGEEKLQFVVRNKHRNAGLLAWLLPVYERRIV